MERVEMKPETMPQNATPEHLVIKDPAECPTCVSGVDPSVGGSLFQEALREGL